MDSTSFDDRLRLIRDLDSKIEEAESERDDLVAAQIEGLAEAWSDAGPGDHWRVYQIVRREYRFRTRLAACLGLSERQLRRAAEEDYTSSRLLPEGSVISGRFPLTREHALPPPKQWCIYYLLAADDEIMYIGKSQSVALRLSSHWVDEDKWGIVSWRVVVMAQDAREVSDVELALIARHNPTHNTMGRTA